MIDLLNSLYRALPVLGEMSLTAAYAAAVAAVLRLVLRKRAPKQVLCVLWLVVFARLLIPVNLESPLSILPDQERVQAVQDLPAMLIGGGQAAPEQNPGQIPAQGQPSGPAANPVSQGNVEPDAAPDVPALSLPGGVTPSAPRDEPQAGFPWQALLAGVWLAGALAMGLYGIISCLRLKRRLFDAIRSQDGAWEHPAVGSPFILGVIRPKIYLPAGLCGQPRQLILCHERAHLRRLDHIVKPLCWVALALHWFNPAVWAAFILMSKDIEAACDEAVIRRLGPKVKADYSATLLALATGGRMPAPCPLAFDEGNAKGRIQNVLRYRRPALWIVVVSVVMAVLAAVCLLTDPVSAREPDENPDPSASQSQAPEEDGVLDPWMVEVLAGRQNFTSVDTGENVNIDLLNGAYPYDVPYDAITLSKFNVVDLDRDGLNELVLWPTDEQKYQLGSLILHRQGDEVGSYSLGYRAFGSLKADGTFFWSGGTGYYGIGSARFTKQGVETAQITWCEVLSADQGAYFVDGRSATSEEFQTAIEAWYAKPDPVWYVFEDGVLKYAPINVPIPLDEYAQAAPVPDFLDEDQQLLYRQTYSLYSHIFGANTEEVDSWPGNTGFNYDYQNPYSPDGVSSYVPATGLYANWADFEEAVLSVFTRDFWNSRNGAGGTDTYINHEGILFYQPAARGNNGNNGNFPETFRLVERTEESITFVTTAYYTEHPGDVPAEGWDAYLRSHWDYTQDFPIRMVKTDRGWRFDQFYCPMTDANCYPLAACGPTPRRPDSLENHRPGPLTQEELDYFNRYFEMGLAPLPSIRSMLLMSEYDRPQDIDLYVLFYHGLDAWPEFSQAEYDALGWNEYGEKFRVTTAQMNGVLQQYAGLTLEQTNGVGLDKFRYLAETDAYYAIHQDTAAESTAMLEGQYNRDGTVSLTYRYGELEGQYRTVTLERVDGLHYRVLSNRAAAAPDSGPEPEASASPEPAPSAAPTACEHGLEDVRLEYVGGQLAARCNQDDFTYLIPGITSGNWDGTAGQSDGLGWMKENVDGDDFTEVLVYTTDNRIVSLKMVNGSPVASSFDYKTLVDDFNQNSTYRLDSENKIMEVSYQGQTKQVTTLDDGYWMYMMTHSGGFSPEIWLADMWCNRLTVGFHIHNGRGADLGLLAACTLAYGSDGRLQAGSCTLW